MMYRYDSDYLKFRVKSIIELDKRVGDIDYDIGSELTIEGLYYKLARVLYRWNYLLYKNEQSENFEMCGDIRDVIKIEMKVTDSIANKYFKDEAEEGLTKSLNLACNKDIRDNIDEWEKVYGKK